jgi:hypothetical protein
VIAAILLMMAQAVSPPAESGPVPLPKEQAETQLREIATRAASSGFFLADVIYDDPKMRAEIRRVGFANGCAIIYNSFNEAYIRHADALLPLFVEATRKAVPLFRLRVHPMSNALMYGRRIKNDVENSGLPAIAAAQDDMRRTFVSYSAKLPTVRNQSVNLVKPKSDLAKALGVTGNWDLDKSTHLQMACVEQAISPRNRPTISTGDSPK